MRATAKTDWPAKRASACIFVLIVSNGCEASGEMRPNASPDSEPYTISSSDEAVPTVDRGFSAMISSANLLECLPARAGPLLRASLTTHDDVNDVTRAAPVAA